MTITIDCNDIVIDGDIQVNGNIINEALSAALDSYADGYISVMKTLSISSAGGYLNAHDSGTVPVYSVSSSYWYCPGLDGTIANPQSDRAQIFNFAPFQIPDDYLSGGIIKVYCFQTTATSGTVAYEVAVIGSRTGSSISSASWVGSIGGPAVSEVVPGTAGIIYILSEIDISGQDIHAGDFAGMRVVRSANHAGDTASSGAMAIVGAEFIYIANVRV